MQITSWDKNVELLVDTTSKVLHAVYSDELSVAADADKVGRVSTVTSVWRSQDATTDTASNRGNVSAIQAGLAPTATEVQ